MRGMTTGLVALGASWLMGAAPAQAQTCAPAAQPRIIVEMAQPEVTVCEVAGASQTKSDPAEKRCLLCKSKRTQSTPRSDARPVMATIFAPAPPGGGGDGRPDRFAPLKAAFDAKYQEALIAATRAAEDEERRATVRALDEASKEIASRLSAPASADKLKELEARIDKLETLILLLHEQLKKSVQ